MGATTVTTAFEAAASGAQEEETVPGTNNGPSTAFFVILEDILPAGLITGSVVSSSGTCNVGKPGETNDLQVCGTGGPE